MSSPLRLPEVYGPQMQRGELDYLVLKRPDGTLVAAFEVSAIGPDPFRIMQIVWNDAERMEQTESDLEK